VLSINIINIIISSTSNSTYVYVRFDGHTYGVFIRELGFNWVLLV
jgi:hypothetical protein